jgi:aryl-alcohol dehydrogenase-like predicted oxidoreductase
MEAPVRLGASELFISPIGVGTWAWGDRDGWGAYDEEKLFDAFSALVDAGVSFFDTAELYGGGESERILGRFLAKRSDRLVVATKFAPLRARLLASVMRPALNGSLRRLGRDHVDLYQIHWQTRWVSIERWMKGLIRAQKSGKATAVGVSNYSVDQMSLARETLSRSGISLVSNQVEFSILCRNPEKNGVLEACKKEGITCIAYSPLATGLLTGKYNATNLPQGGQRSKYSAEFVASISPLIALLTEIGNGRGKSPAQVALNWVICKGAVPIAGVKDKRQAQNSWNDRLAIDG